MPAILTSLATAVSGAILPFAVISDVWVAGLFSVVNTILSAATIYFLNRFLRGVPEKVEHAHEILERQEENMNKRVTDDPDVTGDAK